jgi:hypothetical protein
MRCVAYRMSLYQQIALAHGLLNAALPQLAFEASFIPPLLLTYEVSPYVL